jgi:hypothetical protein
MIFTESGTIRLRMVFDRLFAHCFLLAQVSRSVPIGVKFILIILEDETFASCFLLRWIQTAEASNISELQHLANT